MFIKCKNVLSLASTVKSHGWYMLAPWEWDNTNEILSRPERLPSGIITRLEIHQPTDKSIALKTKDLNLDYKDTNAARKIVSRWLSIDWDPTQAIATARTIDPAISDSIANGHGRFLRGSTFYEDFAKTVCTIQISWAGTKRMVGGLVNNIGTGVFPTPSEVLQAGESILRSAVGMGFRSPQLISATEQLISLGMMDQQGEGVENIITRDALGNLPGIGPYSTNHIRMLLHDYSQIPIDSAVTSSFRENYGVEPEEIETLFERWGSYKFLGYKLSNPQK